jgi:ABC-type sugar transport system ATPase subunit
MLLDMRNISKSFFGVKVLDSVDFQVKKGEVHGLIGGNGAGKSTLMKMVSGFHQPDEGDIQIEGTSVHILSPIEAHRLGVSIIYQETSLVQDMSIAENIFLGVEPRLLKLFTNRRKMNRDTKKIMKSLGYSLHPGTLVRFLSLSDQNAVAIAKALSRSSKILIMDEPTTNLTDVEKNRLFVLLRIFKEQGMGIVYITHRLKELFQICDRITILRDGKHILTSDLINITEHEIVRHMIGKEFTYLYPSVQHRVGSELLKVKGLSRKHSFEAIDFELREGEILGFAGLIGSGRTELAKTIFGELKPESGTVSWRGVEIRFHNPREAIKHRFGFVNRDRLNKGLFPNMNISQNLTISALQKLHKWQFLFRNEEQDQALDAIIQLNIQIQDPDQAVKTLSGGNQQKVMLGKWLVANSELYILDEPTQSIDVGAKSELYAAIHEMVIEGKGMIVLSSDFSELIGLCTRILVMYEGRIVDEMTQQEATEERIIQSSCGFIKTGGERL